MGMRDAIRTCLGKYATFSGRASRPEYWWFVLFLVLGSISAAMLDGALFGGSVTEIAPGQFEARSEGPIGAIFALGMVLPALAAGWRRMHDTGRSGLYLFYPLIVMTGVTSFIALVSGLDALARGDIGAILAGASGLVVAGGLFVLFISPLIVIWWLTRPSVPGPNRYGPNPHEVTS